MSNENTTISSLDDRINKLNQKIDDIEKTNATNKQLSEIESKWSKRAAYWAIGVAFCAIGYKSTIDIMNYYEIQRKVDSDLDAAIEKRIGDKSVNEWKSMIKQASSTKLIYDDIVKAHNESIAKAEASNKAISKIITGEASANIPATSISIESPTESGLLIVEYSFQIYRKTDIIVFSARPHAGGGSKVTLVNTAVVSTGTRGEFKDGFVYEISPLISNATGKNTCTINITPKLFPGWTDKQGNENPTPVSGTVNCSYIIIPTK